ncbi:MAG: bifunctional [glutamate--ammonia ligase]-adenylyl-L-tyrosine phosphorylase/[glutamate--ammonia-ligase] adenylyltransferase, partial [Burkholderiales bacterium]|nr:bifunctional [glutamate--ammonia ligase]-adenylyl-L-tyrosine phosphorylase/[glutamate--ammonia-ligase] adenylyltransferase [Burkholderiales bacterium]
MSGAPVSPFSASNPRLLPEQLTEYSGYFKRSLSSFCGADETKRAEFVKELVDLPLDMQKIAEELEKALESGDLEGQMRKSRRRLMMSLIAKDVTGKISLGEVTSAISDFAQLVVTNTVAYHARQLAKRFGVPHSPLGVPQDLLVVGMGKLGGHELNVSSDIDLIFLYDEDGDCKATAEFPNPRKQISNREFFEKLAKKIIPAISNLTDDGYVFRVDMRLRPNGDSGPIACSSEMLEEYLVTQGRDWERFAWMKGCVVNGPVFTTPEQFKTQDANLYSLVRPFVYRKYLDFNAISALTSLHAKIRASTQLKASTAMTKGQNVKLGRGGIREIEFIAQTFQVIRGGRNPKLRERSTLKALDLLSEEGVLSKEVTDRLKEIYAFLRNVEHALQYREDQQTQLLPDDPAVQQQVAQMLGFKKQEFLKLLAESTEFVAQQFDAIFQTQEEENDNGWPVGWEVLDEPVKERLRSLFKELGYTEPDKIIDGLISVTRQGLYKAVNSSTRHKLRSLLKFVVDNVDAYGDWNESSLPKEAAVLRYIRFLEVITGRPTYLALLLQYPEAAKRVGRLLASSQWAADYLIRHPILLDELLDERNDSIDDFTPVDYMGYKEKVQELLDASDPKDTEARMNILREAHHGSLFRLLLADTSGRLSVERLADQLSALADATLEIAISEAWKTVPGRFDDIEFPKFCTVAYGKLGGKELGYASDLDLIFLYDDDHPEAEKIYARFARRLISWLSAPTSSGLLFDVDMRLRPNGESGMLVTTIDSYKKYERNEDGTGAWLWEHQALSRGRFAAGDPEVGRKFEEIRKEILGLERDPESTAKEILAMRKRMHDGHVNKTELFDLKHDVGGMVDIEFIVQYLVLVNSHKHPELMNNFGNILLLSMAADAGLINKELAEDVSSAYRKYR